MTAPGLADAADRRAVIDYLARASLPRRLRAVVQIRR
jgi:hypothetical protein